MYEMITHHIIELSFAISLLVNALLFIPQIMRLLKSKDSVEVSLITFLGFWLIQLATTLHGVIHKDYLLAIGNLLSLCTCGYVVWLIIFYRLKNKKDIKGQINGIQNS